MTADGRGEQASEAAPFACFACMRLEDSGESAYWLAALRVCSRLTPLIEEHPAHHTVMLALGGSERLLLGSAASDAENAAAIDRVWPRLAEALTRLLTKAVAPGGKQGAASERPEAIRVGIGPTRTLAWLASVSSDKTMVVLPGQEQVFLATLPLAMLRDIPDAAGIASLAAMVAALDASGIRTLGQLQRLPTASLARRFGADGALLGVLAAGDDLRPLRPRVAEQWLGARLVFEPSLTAQRITSALAPLAERLALTLAERALTAGKIALLLESETGVQLHVERQLAHPLGTTRALLGAAERLLAALLADVSPNVPSNVPPNMAPDVGLPAEGERYVTLRLRLGGLHPATAEQARLWAAEQQQAGVERTERVKAALRAIQGGKHANALLRAELHEPDAVLPEERYRLTPRHNESS